MSGKNEVKNVTLPDGRNGVTVSPVINGKVDVRVHNSPDVARVDAKKLK